MVDVCAGVLGDADPEHVQPDTLFNCFSVSKAVAVVPVLQAVDQGLIALDAPVCTAWTEFGCKVETARRFRDVGGAC